MINLFEKIRNNDFSKIHSEGPWIIVVPTYAWRIPRIVQKWLENAVLTGNKKIYFVMTCGENIGNAGKYLKKLCAEKNMGLPRLCRDCHARKLYCVIFYANGGKGTANYRADRNKMDQA